MRVFVRGTTNCPQRWNPGEKTAEERLAHFSNDLAAEGPAETCRRCQFFRVKPSRSAGISSADKVNESKAHDN